jgi:hypothetical protein
LLAPPLHHRGRRCLASTTARGLLPTALLAGSLLPATLASRGLRPTALLAGSLLPATLASRGLLAPALLAAGLPPRSLLTSCHSGSPPCCLSRAWSRAPQFISDGAAGASSERRSLRSPSRITQGRPLCSCPLSDPGTCNLTADEPVPVANRGSRATLAAHANTRFSTPSSKNRKKNNAMGTKAAGRGMTSGALSDRDERQTEKERWDTRKAAHSARASAWGPWGGETSAFACGARA